MRFAPRCAFGAPSSVPSDNHIRQMLDGNPPAAFDRLFVKALESVAAADGLSAFQRLAGCGKRLITMQYVGKMTTLIQHIVD